jgi:short-subunit dehydrogenase
MTIHALTAPRPTHVAVTGASSGIGAAIARELSSRGASVTLIARRAALLQELGATLGGPHHLAVQDLGELARACDWIVPAEAALGPIDVLVNNAGVQILGHTAQISPEEGERLLAVDLLAPLRLIQHTLPGMIARGRGTIVNIASMAALAPTPFMTHYNAAKGGLAAASEALRGELQRTGVNVVTVYPGVIDDTDLARAALASYGEAGAIGRMPRGTSAGLALRICKAIDARQARVVYPASGLWARWFPGPTRWLLDHLTPEPSHRS